jgi:methyltransferase (TIGR00027 family)
MDKRVPLLQDVSNTMLITLYARAYESKQKDPILHDDKAVEMIELIKQELVGSSNPIHQKILKDQHNHFLTVSMALRSRRFDRYVTEFMQRFPAGTVINMGCGLDTRFDRVDNGQIHWFDIDLPGVIELRKRFMQESERRKFISASVTEPGWVAQVRKGTPTLFLAEGLFMYLQEADVKTLLATIEREFAPAELVCEVTNLYWVERMNTPYLKLKFSRQLGMTGGAVFSFGVADSRTFETWSPHYHLVDEWTYFDDNEKRMGWMAALMGKFASLRKTQWTVKYKVE